MKEKTDAYITPNNKHFSFIFKIMPISVDLFNLFHNPFLALYGGIQGFKALKRRVLINKFFLYLFGAKFFSLVVNFLWRGFGPTGLNMLSSCFDLLLITGFTFVYPVVKLFFNSTNSKFRLYFIRFS